MSYRRLLAMGWVGVFALLAAPRSDAQPYLVKNINDPESGFVASSDPRIRGVANGYVIFSADDVEHGREPWATDGTAAGTWMLGDLVPGPRSAGVGSLGTVAGRVVFSVVPSEVWSTDGTPQGTVRLVSMRLGQEAPYDEMWTVGAVADPPGLFFGMHSPHGDVELWVTDGTAEGTRLIAIDLPTDDPVTSVDLGGALLFSSPFGFGGLWRSDGTRSGTFLVHAGGGPLVGLGDGRAVFLNDELWVSDGTAEGTRMIAAFGPGEGIPMPFHMVSDGESGQAFFYTIGGNDQRRLWRTDGTSGGTVALTNGIHLGDALRAIAGRFFVAASDPAHGAELLVSDGTPAGTRLLDLCPGTCSSFPSEITATSVGILLSARDDAHGAEPWLTDGTAAGTHRLADLCPGLCGSFTEVLTDLGGRVVLRHSSDLRAFSVTDGTPAGTRPLAVPAGMGLPSTDDVEVGVIDGVGVLPARDPLHGEEPWRTDGTEGGTALIRDLALDGDAGSEPAAFVQLGAEMFFATTMGLWKTDGTPAGTERVADFPSPADYQVTPLRAGGDLYFLATRNHFTQLWHSDGTASGTFLLFADEFTGEPPILEESTFVAVGDVVYVLGPGLWRAGRLPGSAVKIADLTFVAPEFAKNTHAVLNGRLFFSAFDSLGYGLWTTDGSPGGTRRVLGTEPRFPRELFAHQSRLYFIDRDSQNDEALWRTDGTPAGTELVFSFPGRSPGSDFEGRVLGAAGGRVIFGDGNSLWAVTGGSGTLSALGGPAGGVIGEALVEFRNRLYFVAEIDRSNDGYIGRLWFTDGTPAGTRRADALLPPGHRVENMFRTGEVLVLLVLNPSDEEELWAIDGTPAGSRRLASLRDLETSLFGLFGEGSPPAALGDQLLFAAESLGIGTELWAADLDARLPPFGAPAAPSGLRAEASSESGVRLSWRDNSADETSFLITGATAEESLGGSVAVPAGTDAVIVQGLPPETPFTFTVAAVNSMGTSAPSNEASAAPLPEEPGPCVADAGTLCLLGGRFAVSVLWRDQHNGGVGTGGALPYPGSDRTGLFWFFNPANVELIVKALDGRGVNGAFWSFYGALSDVEYWVTVVDTARRRARTYHNRPGEICGVGDTGAFPEGAPRSEEASASSSVGRREDVPVVTWPYTAAAGEARSAAREREEREDVPAAAGRQGAPPAAAREGVAASFQSAAGPALAPGRRWRRLTLPAAGGPVPLAVAAGSCTPGPEALCLLDGRLRVEVFWQDQHNGGSGTGKAVAGTDKTGFFWFFNPSNVELVVKALDGTTVNGHLWVFYGALSDVEYTIAVTDTATGEVANYHNPPGEICGDADTEAF